MTKEETIKKYEAENTKLNYETEELIDYPQDIYDAAHCAADGDENVIYYYKAHALVQDATSSEVDQAEQTIAECGGYGEDVTYDNVATMIAYWILHQRYIETVTEEVESIRDWMDENEIESDELTEAIETILN